MQMADCGKSPEDVDNTLSAHSKSDSSRRQRTRQRAPRSGAQPYRPPRRSTQPAQEVKLPPDQSKPAAHTDEFSVPPLQPSSLAKSSYRSTKPLLVNSHTLVRQGTAGAATVGKQYNEQEGQRVIKPSHQRGQAKVHSVRVLCSLDYTRRCKLTPRVLFSQSTNNRSHSKPSNLSSKSQTCTKHDSRQQRALGIQRANAAAASKDDSRGFAGGMLRLPDVASSLQLASKPGGRANTTSRRQRLADDETHSQGDAQLTRSPQASSRSSAHPRAAPHRYDKDYDRRLPTPTPRQARRSAISKAQGEIDQAAKVFARSLKGGCPTFQKLGSDCERFFVDVL